MQIDLSLIKIGSSKLLFTEKMKVFFTKIVEDMDFGLGSHYSSWKHLRSIQSANLRFTLTWVVT